MKKIIGVLLICFFAFHPAAAFDLTTNQTMIEQMTTNKLPLDKIEVMFSEVFSKLPQTIKVYPTENYYYFKIFANSGEIWGNLRLDSLEREDGKLSFAYFFVDPNANEPYYTKERRTWHKNFTLKDGVDVKKLDALKYMVTFKDKSVLFELNDLKQEFPQDFKKHPGELLASRMCDESGFYFFLVFNERLSSFYYVLDESMPLPDRLHSYGKDILVGQLSEFAFYKEPGMNRKVLFGVRDRNVERNNYYDGPFDQLADNFVKPEVFQSQLERAYPYYKGRVKGRGDLYEKNGKQSGLRISVSPYVTYKEMPHLWSHVAACQSAHKVSAELTSCIGSSLPRPRKTTRETPTIIKNDPELSH